MWQTNGTNRITTRRWLYFSNESKGNNPSSAGLNKQVDNERSAQWTVSETILAHCVKLINAGNVSESYPEIAQEIGCEFLHVHNDQLLYPSLCMECVHF